MGYLQTNLWAITKPFAYSRGGHSVDVLPIASELRILVFGSLVYY